MLKNICGIFNTTHRIPCLANNPPWPPMACILYNNSPLPRCETKHYGKRECYFTLKRVLNEITFTLLMNWFCG